MAVLSMRARKKLLSYGVAGAAAVTAILVQSTVLSQFPVKDNIPVYCNLPLTVVICWGAIFGSTLPAITPDELRLSSAQQIFTRQMMAGSLSGAVMGALIACLLNSMSGFVGDDAMHAVRIIPFYLPFAGWVAGYFCLRHMNMQKFLIMPLVFVLSLLAETVMAWQLSLQGRPGVFETLMQIAMHEAALNTIIAPFVYVPLRIWYDFLHTTTPSRGT